MRVGIPLDAVLLGISLFLAVAAANILTPLLPLVQAEFGIDYATAGVLVSSFAVARLSLDLPAGFLQERLGIWRLTMAGFLLAVIGSLVAAFGPTFPLVVVGRIGMGLGASIVSVVVLTSLGTMARPEARARILSVYALANNSAISVFPVIGGVAGITWGWRSAMLVCAVLSCLSVALLVRTLRRIRAGSGASQAKAEVSEAPFAISRRRLVALGLVYFGVIIYMVNRHGFRNTALPLFAHDRIGLGAVAIASGITLMAVVGLIVAIPGAAIADRWGRRRVIVAGFALLAIGDLTFLGANSYALFLVASFVLGLGDFFSSSQTTLLTESVPAHWRTRALSGYRFCVDLGATIGPLLLAGLLQMTGFETMVLIAAALLLIAATGGVLGGRAARPVVESPGRARTSELTGRVA